MEKPQKPVCILGSGASILALSEEEKSYLKEHYFIVALNRYLMHWKLVGLFPDAWFIADFEEGASEVFFETLDESGDDIEKVLIFAERRFTPALPPSAKSLIFTRNERVGFNEVWAKSVLEPLYFYRSSLTSLLNLIAVLKLTDKVILAGIDLNKPECFFEQDSSSENKIIFDRDSEAGTSSRHRTSMRIGSMAPLQTRWPEIMKHLSQSEIRVTSANPDSLLVKEKLVDFEAIIASSD